MSLSTPASLPNGSPTPAATAAGPAWLAGGGETGALMRCLDWSATPLGPVERWPQSLRTSVSICLGAPSAFLLWWGPDFVLLPNDASRRLLGGHLAALGRPGRECRPETWHALGPMLRSVLGPGPGACTHDLVLADRPGLPEKAHFTCSHSLIRDETGEAGGVLTLLTEKDEALGAERLHVLTEVCPQFLWTAGPDGALDFCDRRWLAYTGLAAEDIRGDGWSKAVHPDDQALTLDLWQRATQTGQEYQVEHRLRSAAGGYRWFLIRALPLRDSAGRVERWFGTCTDIDDHKQTAEALRDSEERFRDLFENANDIIYTLDLAGRITSINKRAEQMFGQARAESLGLNAAQFVPPEYHARMQDALHRKLAGEQAPTTYELELVSKDGCRVPFEVSSRLIVRGGRPTGVQGIARDITERKQAEAERERLLKQLEAERAFLEAVLQQMPGGVVIAEAPSGRIVLRNEQGLNLFPPGEPLPADVGQSAPHGGLFPGTRYPNPDDWPLLRSLRTGEVVRGEEMDFQLAAGRGTLRASSTPVRDSQGRIIAAVATWFDITERKRAEDAQRFLAEASAALAGSFPGPDVTLERVAHLAVPALADWCTIDVLLEDGSVRNVAVVHADPARAELGRELVRRYPLRLDGPEGAVLRTGEPALLAEITDDMLAIHARDTGHLEALRGLGLRSGMIVPLSARGRALGAITLVAAESGRRYGAADLALAVELARRAALAVDNGRLYRELQEADRRKDEFLAMLAHELRNPLAPIRNAVQVLELLGGPQPEHGQVRAILERQVAHLARLVDDLLDVSRITRGKVLLRKECLDLVPLVRAATLDHQALLEGSGQKLAIELPDRPLWVVGDPTRLTQVVGNLLHNANKFTDAGGLITVRLAGSAGSPNDEAVLTVQDTGIGMEANTLRRLFETFSQADRSIDRSRGGLGLGLALVKGLAELHGGGARATSAGLGQGSELTVRLPLSQAPSARERTRHDQPLRGKSLRALIIEDNRDAAESLRLLLQLSGHEVAVAHTGAAGLAAARQQCPDVVVCDIGLPGGMDGYTVARTLRADPEQAIATLIALSGYGQDEDQRRARQAGFDRHLTKPVDPVVLTQLLDTLPVRPDR